MNQTLRPQPQLGEVLPGALTLALFLLLAYDHDPDAFNYFTAPSTGPGLLAIIGGAFLFASWIFGTLLDTVRNGVVENVVDWCSKHWFHKEPLNWEFFVSGDRDKVTQLDEYFFAYYQAKANYAVGILIFMLACIGWPPTRLVGFLTFGGAALLFVFCTLDSISLRREIKKLTTPHLAAAHAGVYTRLLKSTHGIGVFAVKDIPEGTNVFAGDTNEMREIDKNDFAQVEPAIRQLYEDFCVWKDGKIRGPANFNNLTVGWYLNHSDTPNVRCDEHSYDFIATRCIKKGEEITADYTTYDDRPLNFTPCSGSGQQ
jgi:hypothetical protein